MMMINKMKMKKWMKLSSIKINMMKNSISKKINKRSFFFLKKNSFSSKLNLFSLKKLKEAKLDEQFPDEVDTPMDIPARVRFQKYFN